jgi:hypothetical protein
MKNVVKTFASKIAPQVKVADLKTTAVKCKDCKCKDCKCKDCGCSNPRLPKIMQ